MKSTQELLQRLKGLLHRHFPFEQNWSLGHEFPQEPQLRELRYKLTHLSPHLVKEF
jgi:hypothetical protein